MRQAPKQNRNHNNNNRNKSGRKPGASLNRVYDSTGPEGKVRGTPQQIVDKYQTLARDASTSGDRIVAENFLQHAEHYMRIILATQQAEAEQRAARAAQDQQRHEDRSARDDRAPRQPENAPAPGNHDTAGSSMNGAQPAPPPHAEPSSPEARPVPLAAFDKASDEQPAALVETPESRKAAERAPASEAEPKEAAPEGVTDEPEVKKPTRRRTRTVAKAEDGEAEAPKPRRRRVTKKAASEEAPASPAAVAE